MTATEIYTRTLILKNSAESEIIHKPMSMFEHLVQATIATTLFPWQAKLKLMLAASLSFSTILDNSCIHQRTFPKRKNKLQSSQDRKRGKEIRVIVATTSL